MKARKKAKAGGTKAAGKLQAAAAVPRLLRLAELGSCGCLALGLLTASLLGCQAAERPQAAPAASLSGTEVLARLRRHEAARREQLQVADLPPPLGQFGADPYALVELDDGRLAGIHRGTSELVLLADDLSSLARAPAPAGASGVAASGEFVFAVGELDQKLWVYRLGAEGWEPPHKLALPGVYGLRGVAVDATRVFLIEEDSGRLLTLSRAGIEAAIERAQGAERPEVVDAAQLVLREHAIGAGLVSLTHRDGVLVLNALRDHEIVLFDLRRELEREVARVRHDGPIWAADVRRDGDKLWLVLAGVEDHPLDRTIGSFGNIDSYLYLYRYEPPTGVQRLSAHNLSELGVVTPKVALFEHVGDVAAASGANVKPPPSGAGRRFKLVVSAFGSAKTTRLALDTAGSLRVLSTLSTPPGSASGVVTPRGVVLANPLVDRWLLAGSQVAERREAQSNEPMVRLGEALFFTTLMAPFNLSEGPLSRFTCETCHFEGGVDGRTHHTGRQNIRATTKPLVGLFNNKPHFSRALDRDLSQICHAEFRVAGANSGHEPVFAIARQEFPWLEALALPDDQYDAFELRLALMEFLIRFTPPTNPRVVGRDAFDELERRGAELFALHCETCHAARLSADDPGSVQPFERWAQWVFSPAAPLVWGSDGYQKTGVLPYVHAQGARTPSLRRLYKKHPYFTNGSAESLGEVLEQVRVGPVFSHAGGNGLPLRSEERQALLAFLQLL